MELAVFCTQGSCLLDKATDVASTVLEREEAERVLDEKVRNTMLVVKRSDTNIVMWAPHGALVDALLQRVAKATDTAN